MSIRSFFFGNINETSCAEPTTFEEEPNYGSPLQDLSYVVEDRTGVALHQNSHTYRHGLAGLLGFVDRENQEWEQACDEAIDGTRTDEEMGEAWVEYHDSENRKSGLRYFLGF